MNFFSKVCCLLSCSALFFVSCEAPQSQSNGGDTPLFSTCKIFHTKTSDSAQFKEKITFQNEPLFHKQWYLCNTSGIDINIVPVWEKGYGTKPISVGILDEAIDIRHPDLTGSVPENEFVLYDPKESHGTNVAGLLAARDNSIGIIGVVPRARIYGYCVIDPVETTEESSHQVSLKITKALNRPEHRTIAVYNASLGNKGEQKYVALSSSLKEAMDTVTTHGFYKKGSSLVFAAGNDGIFGVTSNTSYLRHYAVIAVNSIDKNGTIINRDINSADQRFSFSSTIGVNVWITAPGDDMITTDNEEKYEEEFGGTSGAAPLISGAIALLRSEFPDLTWRDVKLIVAESAKKYDDEDNAQYRKSGTKYSDGSEQQHSRRMGFGLLDVDAAFELAEDWNPLPPMKTYAASQSTPLSITKNTKHTSKLTVTGSTIQFIESVTIEMNIKKTKELIGLTQWNLQLIDPKKTHASIYGDIRTFRERAIISDNTLTFVINSFLGSSADGNWTLEIQQNEDDIINEITDWKLTFRGH